MTLFATRNFIKRILTSAPQTKLGRWEHRHSDKQLEFKQKWANSDHCGDIICGKPEQIKMNMKKK